MDTRTTCCLTKFERRLLRHVAAGGTNNAIAARLQLTPDSVNNRLVCIYRKLGARNRAHAVAIAAHNGFITLDHVVPRYGP